MKARVSDAFASLGGQVNQSMALVTKLEALGWTSTESITAINDMLTAGILLRTVNGGLRMATK